jgi:hypothetical protein
LFTQLKRQAFIKLFKEYKDIFAWTYDELKIYDTKIIQHIIPMKPQTKPFSKKVEENTSKLGASGKG